MNITIMLKDPDGYTESVKNAVWDEVNQIPDLTPEEREALADSRIEEVNQKLKKWIEYQEYLYVTFDLDAGTATVLNSDGSD